MPDRYPNFAMLAACEDEGADFQVRYRLADSPVTVIAPHGGGIEAGTSELAEAVAGREHWFYAFEGIRGHENADSSTLRGARGTSGCGPSRRMALEVADRARDVWTTEADPPGVPTSPIRRRRRSPR